MKYTFEIMKEYEDAFRGISVYSVSEEKKLMVDFVAREELEDAQKKIDEAYHRGYDKGYADKTNFDEVSKELAKDAYQRGLDEAWEAARKIFGSTTDGGYRMGQIREILGKNSLFCATDVIRQCTINEVIEKLKAYEEKQKEEDDINVGDVVEWDGTPLIVTRIFKPYNQKEQCDGIDEDGSAYAALLTESLTKTGRHFDIGDLLKGVNWT